MKTQLDSLTLLSVSPPLIATINQVTKRGLDAYPTINVNGSDQRHVSFDALDPTSLFSFKWVTLVSLLLAPCKLNLSPPLSHLKLYQGFLVSLPLTVLVVVAMGGFENRVKIRAIEVKLFFKKGVKVVSSSCKKGWWKIKHIKH